MYHRFYRSDDNGGVSADLFERQVATLSRSCECLTVTELVERRLNGSRASKGRPVACITVDDGYSDFYEVAFPILRKYQVPATFYVSTGFVDGSCWLWYDRLKWIVAQNVSVPVDFGDYHFEVDQWNRDKSGTWGTLVSKLLRVDGKSIELQLAELARKVGVVVPEGAPSGFKAVSWPQLRELHKAGIEIGAHTVNHYSLGRLDQSDAEEEVRRCRERLKEEIGAEPKAFCYPNGQPADVPENYVDLLRNTGFSSSVVAYYDRKGPADTFALRRHGVGNSWYEFQKTVAGIDRLGAVLLNRNNVFDWGSN